MAITHKKIEDYYKSDVTLKEKIFDGSDLIRQR